MTRLDELLGRVDAELVAWEASPHSWSPGDPLHQRPECTDDCYDLLDACTAACVALPACGHECEHQHVRPLLEVFEDTDEIQNAAVSTRWLSWCKTCQVGWASDSSPVCWVCGVDEMEALSQRLSGWVTDQLVHQDLTGDNERVPRFQLDSWQRAVLASIYPGTISAAAAAEEEQARRRVLEQ